MRFNYGNNRSLNLIQESLVEEWQSEDWSKGPEKTKTAVEQGVNKYVGEFDSKSSLDDDFFKLLRVGLTAPLKIIAKTADFATNPFLSMMGAIRNFSKEQKDNLYNIILDKGMALLKESGKEGTYYNNVRDFMTLSGKSAEEIDQLFDAENKTNFETEYKNIFKQLLAGGLSGGSQAFNRLTARPGAEAFKTRIMDSSYNDRYRDKEILTTKPLYHTIVPGHAQYLTLKGIKDGNGQVTKDIIDKLKLWSNGFNSVLDKKNKNSFINVLQSKKNKFKNSDVVIKTVTEKFFKLKNQLDLYPKEGETISVFEPLKNQSLLKISNNIQYPSYIRELFDALQNIIDKDVIPAFEDEKEKQSFKVLIENSWKEIFKLKDVESLKSVASSTSEQLSTGELSPKLKSLGINVTVTSFDIMQADLDIDNIKAYYEIEKNIFGKIVTEYDEILLKYNDESDDAKKQATLPELVTFEATLKAELSNGITLIDKIDTQFSKTIRQILSDINKNLDKIQADAEVRRSISNLGFLGDYYSLLFLSRLSESGMIYEQLSTDNIEYIGDAFDILEDKIDAKLKAANINPDSVSVSSNMVNQSPVITNSKSMLKEILKVLDDEEIKDYLEKLKLESKLKEIFKLYEEDDLLSQDDIEALLKDNQINNTIENIKEAEPTSQSTTQNTEDPKPTVSPTRMKLTNEKTSKEKLKKAITQVMDQFKIQIKDNGTIDKIVESIIDQHADFEKIFSNNFEFPKEEPKIDQGTSNAKSNIAVQKSTTKFEAVDFRNAELYQKTLQFIGDFIVDTIMPLKAAPDFTITNNKDFSNAISTLQSRLSTITTNLSKLKTPSFNELKQMINELAQLVTDFNKKKDFHGKNNAINKIITIGENLSDKIVLIMEEMLLDPLANKEKLKEKFSIDFLKTNTESNSKEDQQKPVFSSDKPGQHTTANSLTTKIPNVVI